MPRSTKAPATGRKDTARYGRRSSHAAGYRRVVSSPVGSAARRMTAAAIQRSWGTITRLGAISPETARGRRFGRMGKGACIAFPPGALFGEEWSHIGDGTLIGPDVSLSAGIVPGHRMVTNPVRRIGDRCTLC